MSAILAENKLHHEYWRKKSGTTTIAYVPSTTSGYAPPPSGFSFGNAIDDSAGTSFMVTGFSDQVDVTITFPVNVTFNGFAVYGHNLTSNQGLKITYSTSDSGTGNFSEFKATPYTSNTYKPLNNFKRPFGALFSSTISNVRRLRIETIAWSSKSFINIISAGMWVTTGIDIATPFTPPSFSPQKTDIKQNNLGNPLITDVRKVPEKLNIKLNQFSEDELYSATDAAQTTTINGFSSTFGFIDYMGYFLPRHPFFLMWHEGISTESATLQIRDQQKMYFCTMDRQLSQPKFTTPTLINWSIRALGYIE